MTITSRSRNISAICFRSAAGIVPPVGFCGEFSTTILVFGLRRLRKRSRSKEKPRDSSSGMGTAFGAEEANHRFVNREAGVGVDHFIARLEQRQHGEENDRFAARHHRNVLRAHADAARGRNVGGDGLAQIGKALRGAVMRPAFVQRFLGSFHNVGRRREIGLADLQMDNALALRLQRARSDQHIEGRFDPDAAHSFR